MALLLVAAFGFLVPNGLFLYWLVFEFESMEAVLGNRLGLGFMIDAFLATGLLAYLFATRPPGPVSWRAFVGLSILGGLGFSIPCYLWLNWKRSSTGEPFMTWWAARG